MNRKAAGWAGIAVALVFLLVVLAIPLLIVGGLSEFFASGQGVTSCTTGPAAQPGVSAQGKSIPADYLAWYRKVGLQYNIPWTILAGIGTEESDNGQSTAPGVHSGQNGFGAAGPMQLGIGGASTNTWGGAPVHPASQKVAGVATDEDGDGVANVYDPADAIAGAARYLAEHGFAQDPSAAIFAYNHAGWYVAAVENFASSYAAGGFTVSQVNPGAGASGGGCPDGAVLTSVTAPNPVVAMVIRYAEAQLGKPYVFGATGPDAFDCSGLTEMAYQAAGIAIPRTAAEQYHWGPAVAPSAVSPGDLVFFAGADGTRANPGHVGIVIGKNTMIEAYATGFPLRVAHFGTADSPAGEGPGTVVGFTRPWANSSVHLPASELGTPTASASPSAAGGAAAPSVTSSASASPSASPTAAGGAAAPSVTPAQPTTSGKR